MAASNGASAFIPTLPDSLALIVGDAIHNLRSALDLLMRQLVLTHRKDPKREAFLIGDSKTDFTSGRYGLKTLKGRISSGAIDVLRELKPYKGGNDTLWRLHELDIRDKHRLLLVVGGGFTRLILVVTVDGEETATELPLNPFEFLCPLKDGDVIPIGLRQQVSSSTGSGDAPKLDMDYKFSFAVAIHEPGVVEREPLVAFLNHLTGTVEGTLAAFEPLIDKATASE